VFYLGWVECVCVRNIKHFIAPTHIWDEEEEEEEEETKQASEKESFRL